MLERIRHKVRRGDPGMGPISRHLAVVAPQATLSCVEQQWVARIPAITLFVTVYMYKKKVLHYYLEFILH